MEQCNGSVSECTVAAAFCPCSSASPFAPSAALHGICLIRWQQRSSCSDAGMGWQSVWCTRARSLPPPAEHQRHLSVDESAAASRSKQSVVALSRLIRGLQSMITGELFPTAPVAAPHRRDCHSPASHRGGSIGRAELLPRSCDSSATAPSIMILRGASAKLHEQEEIRLQSAQICSKRVARFPSRSAAADPIRSSD